MQEPWRDILEGMPSAILAFDWADRLSWANAAGLRLLQTHLDVVKGQKVEWLLRERLSIHSDLEALSEPDRPIRAGLIDGRRLHLATRVQRFERSGPWSSCLFLDDAVEIYRAEDLKAEIQRYRQILEELPVEVVVFDADERFEYVNPAAMPDPEQRRWVLGRSEAELARRRGFPEAEVVRRRREHMARTRRTGQVTRFEEQEPEPGGRRHFLRLAFPLADHDGQVKRLLGCGIDITDRVEAEQSARRRERAVRESQIRYRRLFDQSRDIVSISDLDGRLIDVNRAGVELLGYDDKEQILNLDVGAVVWREPGARKRIFKQAKARGFAEFEARFLTREREERWVSGTMVEMRDEQGTAEGYLTIVRDVSEQRQVEDQLRQSQKMEAIGRLAGGIAHDFNNLLTAIAGYCDMILDGPPGEQAWAYVREIDAAGRRASELTRKLLSLSRKEKADPKVVSLNAQVSDLEGLLGRLIGEDVELVVKLDPDVGRVSVDPGELDQGILNLATNARDAMPQGGRLVLKTFRETTESSGEMGPDWLCLSVADTGVGIDPATLEHIYEPFYTTKEAGKGTGLGLTTTYAMVHHCGGRLDVKSEVGKGTTFVIKLPQMDEDLGMNAGSEPAAAPERGSETILLVEDDEVVRQLITAQLKRQGYRALAAGSGEDALKLWHSEGPLGLLVSDVVMPGMSGPELALSLRKLQPELPILFISGYPGSFLIRHGFDEAVHDVLNKPFTAKALAGKVRAILDAQAGDRPKGQPRPGE